MKHSKLLFGLVAVLGAAFVTIFFAGLYLWSIGLENILTLLPNTQLGLCFVLFCLLGGTSLLTVGLCGIERQYLRNNQDLLTILTAIAVPSFIIIPYFYWLLSSVTVNF